MKLLFCFLFRFCFIFFFITNSHNNILILYANNCSLITASHSASTQMHLIESLLSRKQWNALASNSIVSRFEKMFIHGIRSNNRWEIESGLCALCKYIRFKLKYMYLPPCIRFMVSTGTKAAHKVCHLSPSVSLSKNKSKEYTGLDNICEPVFSLRDDPHCRHKMDAAAARS